MSQVMVVYNADSTDAWCGAWLMDRCFNGTQMVAAKDTDDPPIVDGRTAFFVGLCYPLPRVNEIQLYAHRAIMFDHSKASRSVFRKHENCIYDSSRSSCMLAYDWCNYRGYVDNYAGSGLQNNRDVAKGMRSIVMYVQDKELGNNRLPNSLYINECIDSYSFDLREWDMLARKASFTPESLTNDGIAIQRYKEKKGLTDDASE